MKKDFILPIIILSVICLLVSGLLAAVNNITKPVIENTANKRTEIEKKGILPLADEFILIKHEDLPRTIKEVYKTSNNIGYIFMISVRGYGRNDLKILCGIDNDGRIIKAAVLEHSETISFFNRVFDENHAGKFWGKNINEIEEIDSVTGATITSNALKTAMRDSLTAYEIITGRF